MNEPGHIDDDSACHFEILPNELIYKVLCYDTVDLAQLINLSYTCKRLNHLCSGFNNELWKIKFYQRWPQLYNRIYSNKTCSPYGCWKDELRSRYVYGKETEQILEKISHEQYFEGEISFKSFAPFEASDRRLGNPNGIHFQIDELNLVLNDGNDHGNLTIKYYAQKVIRFLKHKLLRPLWENYVQELEGFFEPPKASQFPTENVSIQQSSLDPTPGIKINRENERFPDENFHGNFIYGATLFSQWCQPTKFICSSVIEAEIDRLALEILEQLRSAGPTNAFFLQRHGVLLSNEEARKLNQSLYHSQRDCKLILECISHYLYKSWRDPNSNEDEPIYIDEVLKSKDGIPLSLAIIHQAITAKFGVRLMILDFPRRPLLLWKASRETNYYIDVVYDGKILQDVQLATLQEIIEHGDSFYQKLYSPARIFRTLSWYVIEEGRQEGSSVDLLSQRNGLELLSLISPYDSEPKLLLSRIYIHLNINLDEVDNMLREINANDPSSSSLVMFLYQSAQSQILANSKGNKVSKISEKRRLKSQDVKYAVGMVMRHEKYNYNCVIYSWDPICAASKDWATQMRVDSLRLKGNQPFYNVLVEDGSTRYAAQENLSVNEHPAPIPHSEIGKYFESFHGTYYIPNPEKSLEYPDDEIVRNEYVENFYHDFTPSF